MSVRISPFTVVVLCCVVLCCVVLCCVLCCVVLCCVVLCCVVLCCVVCCVVLCCVVLCCVVLCCVVLCCVVLCCESGKKRDRSLPLTLRTLDQGFWAQSLNGLSGAIFRVVLSQVLASRSPTATPFRHLGSLGENFLVDNCGMYDLF